MPVPQYRLLNLLEEAESALGAFETLRLEVLSALDLPTLQTRTRALPALPDEAMKIERALVRGARRPQRERERERIERGDGEIHIDPDDPNCITSQAVFSTHKPLGAEGAPPPDLGPTPIDPWEEKKQQAKERFLERHGWAKPTVK